MLNCVSVNLIFFIPPAFSLERVADEKLYNDDSGEELPLGVIAELRCYDGDQRLPVYKWGLTKGISTDEAANVILRPCVDRTLIATSIPRNVSKNTVFVVDTSKLLHAADIRSDDLGAWQCTGSATIHYSIDESGKCCRHEDPDDCPSDHVLYTVQHQYFSNKSLHSLRKSLISTRQALSTLAQDLIVVQYIFGNGEQEVEVKSHGNSKREGVRAFKRTMKSTRDSMKEKLKELPPPPPPPKLHTL